MSLVKYEILNKVVEVRSFIKVVDVLVFMQLVVSYVIINFEIEFGFLFVN